MLGRPHKLVVRRSTPAPDGLRRISAAHSPAHLPFPATLSLDPLLEYWKSALHFDLKPLAPGVFAYLKEHPHLSGPIRDPSILEDHRRFLDLLMLPLFPVVFAENEPSAALVPFEYRSIYSTAAFQRLFTQEAGMLSGRVNLDLRTLTYGKLISAYLHVIRSIYKVEVPFEYPVIFTTQDAKTGLDRHYKIRTDLRFVHIRAHDDIPQLDNATLRDLLANFTDLSRWMDVIPPEIFEFYGFTVMRAYDVTDEQVIGLLERDLVDEESLVGRTTFPDVEDHVRTLLQMPNVELGLATIDGRDFYLLNEPSQPLADTFFAHSTRHDLSALEGSLFERTLESRVLQTVEDLEQLPNRSRIEEELFRWGVRCVIAAPLYTHSDRVGVLYLWSPVPRSLSALNVMKLIEVLPIFAAAVKRVREEMRNRVQSMIMGKYTAIHPSVEWRFREAARNMIQRQERGDLADVEPIVFEEVYPLYASTDIRGSSVHRNEAIQLDLLDHLSLAEEILMSAQEEKPLAIFYHLLARILRYKKSLSAEFSSADEATTRDFLQRDLEPILLNLRDLNERLEENVQRYQDATNDENGALYRRSRAYEGSVSALNETISDFLDDEQRKMQGVLPHYFEKRQTDGVDFSIYVGASLMQDGRFDPLDVNLLRLWQLMVLCGAARRVGPLQQQLALPLETTHLIIVQNAAIDIRYRFDETRFDVDGPHHVRFEIMKQRVEKANIRDSSERLTQPDRIAIVYSHEREASEYAGYIAYLRERGFINGDVEDLDLDDLPGMPGLRALRVHVAVDSATGHDELDPSELYNAVEALAR